MNDSMEAESYKQKDWDNWRWQFKNRIRTFNKLKDNFKLTDKEYEFITQNEYKFPISITPYYKSIIEKSCLRKTMIPVIDETYYDSNELEDPLSEDKTSPIPNLVHKYPDRVLILSTNICSNYCRFCTRSRRVGHVYDFNISNWNDIIKYIREHKQIKDCLISGGDALTLSDDKLEWLIKALKSIEHVSIVRIGTKVPVVMPQRINKSLINMLKKYRPLYMNIHVTHPDELNDISKKAFDMLSSNGIILGSQTVLLKDINDDEKILKEMFYKLLSFGCKPYYLYNLDFVQGSNHFRVPISKGVDIMNNMKGYISGMAVPQYIIDTKYGKIPVVPDYVQKIENNKIYLRSYNNKKIVLDY